MKKYKPTSAGRRDGSVIEYKKKLTSTDSNPYKRLTVGKKNTGGRNSQGRITTHYRGAGNKKNYRMVDFRYDKKDIPARVETIEYDPNRSGFIALVVYKDGERRYILAPQKLKQHDEIITSEKAKVKVGNRLPLGTISVGTFVYNVEIKPGAGAKLARSAGNYAEVVAQDDSYTLLKMPSTEVRRVSASAWASIGAVSNEEYRLVDIGKAGRARHRGLRPKTRGAARNAVDHPHGGGEGRSPRGHRRQRTKQGRPTGKGQKTRSPKKYSNVFIVSRRKPGRLMGGKR
ncbi:MAG: 50S ribosomal protein L2 [Candidatus Nomurabacteria bacterium]|nr:50S ribosomal protein L2 [Candidatus Nomurabacteria bacterium]USN87463.1 MAG: 50S ribosomal protein L2 [Candidatus Nomurabacteria bacterium]